VLVAAVLVEAVALTALMVGGGSAGGAVVRVLIVVAGTGLLLIGLARGRAAWRALTAVVAGSVGVVSGAGIGAGHLAKSVLSTTTWLGLVVLAVGLLLLGAGAVLSVRALHRWWRLLALPTGFLLFQFVLLPLGMAVYATNVPPTTLGTATPARYGLSYQDVVLRASDGVQLSAWYLPSTNRAAVVVLHGAGSTRTDVLDQAVVLARHGYGVLLPDARGHGRSGGHAMDFGWYGNRDIDAAVTYLASRPDIDPTRIGALGESMGGEQALTAAAADTRISAVVAEGVTARVPGDGAWLPHDAVGLISRGELAVTYGASRMLSGAPRPIPLRDAVAGTAGRPVLIIAGGAAGEITAARFYRAAAPASVQVWEVPDSGHTRALATHPDEWAARVTALFDGALTAGAG
jgi:pimeloyl-ACP methyl ester carboxylesterase